MKAPLLLAALSALCLATLNPNPSYAQATRTWVSGVGDDANPCSRTAPCKTFAGAISKTATAGEIDCLDPGGFGALTITKSITIDCTGTFGSVLASGTNGINVNGVGAVVNLRGLSINGTVTGLIGINFIAGTALNLDRVNVMNFNSGSAIGVLFAPNSPGAALEVNNSYFTNNGIAPSTGGGIVVQPAAGGSAVAIISNSRVNNNNSDGVKGNSTNGVAVLTVRDSTLSRNQGSGINSTAGITSLVMVDRDTIASNNNGVLSSGANSLVRITGSSIFNNQTGVASTAGGVVHSYKNNAINGNAADGTPVTQEQQN
jgi:hypothetical protein